MQFSTIPRRTPLKRSQRPIRRRPIRSTGNVKRKLDPKKTKKVAIFLWVKAIPQSQAHGSGTFQKRLWRLTSDYVRIRDWYQYPYCVATGRKIEKWQDGQAGHFIAYAKCNGLFKFDLDNIFLQSAKSNGWGDYDDWKQFELEIKNRGIDVEALRIKNRDTQLKFHDHNVIDNMEILLVMMKNLPEQPEYFDRAYTLLQEYHGV